MKLAATDLLRLWGRNEQPQPSRLLSVGALHAQLDGPDLRWVTLNGKEFVRRIYVAVRDPAWGTVHPSLVSTEVQAHSDRFSVNITAVHRRGPIWFEWTGVCTVTSTGTISYAIDGHHRSSYEFARIGLNIHHTPEVTAGVPFRARGRDGETRGRLPSTIGAQRLINGTVEPLFPPMTELQLGVGPSSVAFRFEGSLFEMEDQRNWTDHSFKTYSSPPQPMAPHHARRGERMHQRVEIRALGSTPAAVSQQRGAPVALTIGAPTGTRVPEVGLSMNSRGWLPTPDQVDLLRLLGPCHLRANLARYRDVEHLRTTSQLAETLGCGLELAVQLGDDTLTGLQQSSRDVSTTVTRVSLTGFGPEVIGPTAFAEAKTVAETLFPEATIAGGTSGNFVDLNRNPEAPPRFDTVVYPICPQVHACDDASLFEGLEAQAATVSTALKLIGDAVVVTPITLAPRSFPLSPSDPATEEHGLPPSVDPRQPTQFLAAWTAGSLKYLSEAGVEAATYFETVGWKGIIERYDAIHPDFPSRPGLIFPVYHVLADACGWRGLDVLECSSSNPLTVVGLAVRESTGTGLLIANLTPFAQTVRIEPLPASAAMRRLNVHTPQALDPATAVEYRKQNLRFEPTNDVELAPYAVAKISASADGR